MRAADCRIRRKHVVGGDVYVDSVFSYGASTSNVNFGVWALARAGSLGNCTWAPEILSLSPLNFRPWSMNYDGLPLLLACCPLLLECYPLFLGVCVKRFLDCVRSEPANGKPTQMKLQCPPICFFTIELYDIFNQ